jgi:putative transposase
MPFKSTTFSHLLSLIPRKKFQECVDRYRGDKYAKSFSCWNQFVSILYLQLTGKRSLRELSVSFNHHENTWYHLGCGPVKRSTLSDANDKRDFRIYADLLRSLISTISRKDQKTLGQSIHILDSTFISLHQTLHPWASQGHRVYGLKAQVVYAPAQQLPIQLEITHANINDPFFFKRLKPERKTLYLFDRGYWDFRGWKKILSHQADFLTRTKNTLTYRSIRSLDVHSESILSDDYVQLTSEKGKRILGDKALRVIRGKDNQGRIIELITSKLHESASHLLELYRKRWAIEVFFKWIKQKLKIKRYVGRSENAIRIQLIIAIIAFILLRLCHELTQSPLELCYFFSVFSEHLMRPLNRKIFDPPPNLKKNILNQWVRS